MADSVEFSKGVSQFSAELYKNAIAGKESNVILSPLSIQMAVALAYMGASGETARSMAAGLKLNSLTRDQISNQIHDLIQPLQNNTMLKIANKVYVMDNYHVKKEFHDIATNQFYSDSQSINFADAENSATTINNWVEENTNKKIRNLIKPDSLGSDSRMVLVNAIYFKGTWEHQFSKHRTAKEDFYINDVDTVKVDMMHNKESFKFAEFAHLDAKAIELNYKDSDMSMLIFLPNTKTGLAKLEQDLSNVDFNELSQQMYSQKVSLALPKFKINFEISLKDTLTKMGMGEMFGDNADFGNLLESTEPIKVSEVIHKAFIDVNEEGAEAAAATGINMMMRCMPAPCETLTFDHSFCFLLRNHNTKSILFAGRFNNPAF